MTPQRANILLSGCLGICLFALGFLLGRESNRAPATVISMPPAGLAAAEPLPAAAPSQALAPTTASSASPAEASPAAGPPAATLPAVASRTSTSISSLRTSPTSTLPKSTSPTNTSPAAADDSAERQAVARYFREVDRLQNVDVDNPEASATSLIGAATSGDTSGLRALVSQARDAEQKVRAVTPPPPCAHYHEQLLSMLAESRSMLQRLEQGLAGGDVESLSALISQANSAKSRSGTLADEARELKRRYGVAP